MSCAMSLSISYTRSSILGPDSSGRVWGAFNRDHLPFAEVIELAIVRGRWFFNVKRGARRVWEGVNDHAWAGFSLFVDNPERWIELELHYAEGSPGVEIEQGTRAVRAGANRGGRQGVDIGLVSEAPWAVRVVDWRRGSGDGRRLDYSGLPDVATDAGAAVRGSPLQGPCQRRAFSCNDSRIPACAALVVQVPRGRRRHRRGPDG